MRVAHPALLGLKKALAPPLWRLLAGTVRVRPRPSDRPPRPEPVIFACLHRDFLPALLYVRPWRPVLLVSGSPDGEVLIRALAPSGFGFVRGSTGKGGGPAFVRLLGALREGRCVGVAVDGPRGPFGQVQEGVVQLARLSGRPIVPLRALPGRHWRLRTWDRTVVPRPGSLLRLEEGAPLSVAAGAAGEADAAPAARLARALLGAEGGGTGGPEAGREGTA